MPTISWNPRPTRIKVKFMLMCKRCVVIIKCDKQKKNKHKHLSTGFVVFLLFCVEAMAWNNLECWMKMNYNEGKKGKNRTQVTLKLQILQQQQQQTHNYIKLKVNYKNNVRLLQTLECNAILYIHNMNTHTHTREMEWTNMNMLRVMDWKIREGAENGCFFLFCFWKTDWL